MNKSKAVPLEKSQIRQLFLFLLKLKIPYLQFIKNI